jgi:hypothetical protein
MNRFIKPNDQSFPYLIPFPFVSRREQSSLPAYTPCNTPSPSTFTPLSTWLTPAASASVRLDRVGACNLD